MRPNNDLNEILAELAREHREIEAPAFLERRLVEATQSRKRTSFSVPRVQAWAVGLGLAAAALCAVGVYFHRPGRHIDAPTPLVSSSNTPVSKPLPAVSSSPIGPQAPVVRRARVTAHPKSPVSDSSSGLPDSFLALPSSEGLPPPSSASLVRLRIEKNGLRQYGLDVSPTLAQKTILAEFLVGEDGLPRAVRFVR